jgi:RNA polymerase sigma factor (sigma-70 family)
VSVHLGQTGESAAVPLAELIDAIRAGDQHAAAELVRQYEPEIRRFVRFRLTDPRLRRLLDSVDICQSVMARFFNRIQTERLTVEHPLQLLKLLTTMARNSLCDHARKARVRRQIAGVNDGLQLANIADPRISVEDLAEQADLVSRLRSRLRTEDQQVMDLWVQGNGWEVLSKQFGCEPDALRKRLTRAIDRAAQSMGLLEADDA